jgi:glutathionylspermidine synthase
VDWRRDERWIVKPALGRVGEDVGIRGVCSAKEWSAIEKSVRRHPGEWVAQRKFEAAPVEGRYPCLGVFTVDGKAAGIYGRMARRALVDHASEDVAVLVQSHGLARAAG